MGVNVICMVYNFFVLELLMFIDKMGILVLNEFFDSWYKKKILFDFYLIFVDWYEQDLCVLVCWDKNYFFVIMWYIGNEVGEQYIGEDGVKVVLVLKVIVKSEDLICFVIVFMNWVKVDFFFSVVMDLISFNYQGEGI